MLSRTSDPDPLLNEALHWAVRLRAGEPTRGDVEVLQRWRQQGRAHEEAFKKAARLLRNAGATAQELADEGHEAGVAAVFQRYIRTFVA
jgi:transmembrane sensor